MLGSKKCRYWTWYGLMQAGQAKALLKMSGHKIRAENMGLGNSWTCCQEPSPPQNQSHSSTRKMLGKRDIDTLAYRDGKKPSKYKC
jgi:hypothetical protein